MVTLNKIYTKTGDHGETSLVGGQRVSKHSLRPEAFGEVDELNSIIGILRTDLDINKNLKLNKLLEVIQNELFDLGADLATPEGSKYSDKALRITNTQVARLEKEIDIHNKKLDELKSFVLPGGTKPVSNKPFNSSILLVLRLIKPSMLLQYSSNVFTSGGKELILGLSLIHI